MDCQLLLVSRSFKMLRRKQVEPLTTTNSLLATFAVLLAFSGRRYCGDCQSTNYYVYPTAHANDDDEVGTSLEWGPYPIADQHALGHMLSNFMASE